MKNNMTDKQKTMANLRMVLEELPKLAEKMPSIREEFNMEIYGCFDWLEKEKIHQCESYGCLLGNIARLFPVKDEYFDSLNQFNYNLFGKEEFLFIYNKLDSWCFLFDFDWSKYQPTFDQAMKRLEYFIKHDGELPNWDYQTEDFI